MRNIFLFIWICLFAGQASAQHEIDTLLHQLDKAIEERPVYIRQKEKDLAHLKDLFRHTTSDEQRYSVLGKMFNEYQSYNTDSSLHIAQEKYKLAVQLGKKDRLDDARMNTAEIMGTTGMYKEALEIMKEISIHELPDYLHSYYYHIYRTVYGLMADYAITAREKKEYSVLTDHYRDSLLIMNPVGSLTYTLVKADQYNVRGDFDQAIRLLTDYYTQNKENIHDVATVTYTLAEAYTYKGDPENAKKYLTISAIADMKSAVREYVSLRKLAVLLYRDGDIDRAYNYLQQCMDDATVCNARWRILEVQQIFPIINEAYHQKVIKQKHQMKVALICISLLSFFLILAVIYVYKQMKRVAVARQQVVEANKQLQQLNEELHQSNSRLKETNHALAETSYIKEEYIGRYMDQCSVYLEKMDAYRRSLGKIAATGKVEELYKHIKSVQFIENELKEFYANFDDTFLNLFPSFVEDFNVLLVEEERVQPKAGEKLNTELRIFALVRLGITDSVKIAQFLRYSVTTIYNYRTKARNKALGERDDFEKKVMKIGKAGE